MKLLLNLCFGALLLGCNSTLEPDTKEEESAPPPVPEYEVKNQETLSALKNAGDNPDKARKFSHFFYFTSEKSAKQFLTFAKANRYETSLQSAQGLYGVELQIMHNTQPETITKITTKLVLKTRELSGEYDGWGSPVTQ
jgi:hypothetical protein